MGRSHSSITSFRKAAWAKVQREGSGEMQPHSSLRSLSLSCTPPAPLILFSLCLSSSLVFSLLYYLFCFLLHPFSCFPFTPSYSHNFCFPSCCPCSRLPVLPWPSKAEAGSRAPAWPWHCPCCCHQCAQGTLPSGRQVGRGG